MRRITCDESEEDAAYVAQYSKDVEMLAGIVIEALETNPSMILSPLIRQMIVEKARLVANKERKLWRKLHVDNPSEPLI